MKHSAMFRHPSLLAAAIVAALLSGAAVPIRAQPAAAPGEQAQQDTSKKARAKGKTSAATAAVEQYPQATRKSPGIRASAPQSRKLQKVVDLYDQDKGLEARALAEEVMAEPKANAYDKSFAAQMAAQVAHSTDDTAAAIAYLNQAIEFNGLDNNGHFALLLMLAQLQLQEDQYQESVATFDRLFAQTQTQKPEHLALKGNALYRMERYAEAAEVLKQAIATSPEPKDDWSQLLVAAYFDAGKGDEAARLAEQIAARNPSDKRAQMNLTAAYLQTDSYDKAAAVMEKLRAAGQLTEDREYRQLYSTYLNIDGQERKAAEVIAEGLQKGVLQPSHDTYLALGQSYYFSEQVGPAIEAYQKAAPLAKDGETYLNLAKLFWQEERIGEAKAAARQAVAKGLKNTDEAKKIIALPGS